MTLFAGLNDKNVCKFFTRLEKKYLMQQKKRPSAISTTSKVAGKAKNPTAAYFISVNNVSEYDCQVFLDVRRKAGNTSINTTTKKASLISGDHTSFLVQPIPDAVAKVSDYALEIRQLNNKTMAVEKIMQMNLVGESASYVIGNDQITMQKQKVEAQPVNGIVDLVLAPVTTLAPQAPTPTPAATVVQRKVAPPPRPPKPDFKIPSVPAVPTAPSVATITAPVAAIVSAAIAVPAQVVQSVIPSSVASVPSLAEPMSPPAPTDIPTELPSPRYSRPTSPPITKTAPPSGGLLGQIQNGIRLRPTPPPSPGGVAAPAPGILQSALNGAQNLISALELRRRAVAGENEDADFDEESKVGGAAAARTAGFRRQPLDPMALRTFVKPQVFLPTKRRAGTSLRPMDKEATSTPQAQHKSLGLSTSENSGSHLHKCPVKGGCGCGGKQVWKDDD